MQKVKIYIEHTLKTARKENGTYIYNMVCIKKDGTESNPVEGIETLENTTELEISLRAAVQAMERINKPVELEIFTNCNMFSYCYKTGLVDKWEKNGYVKNNKDKVKHEDMWHRLIELRDQGGHAMTITYVAKTSFTDMLQTRLKRITENVEEKDECN